MGRKDWRTILGVFISGGVAGVVKAFDGTDELAGMLAAVIMGLFASNIGGIALEDHGAKVNLPTPVAQQPKAPKLPIVLLLVLSGSLLACAGPACAEGPAPIFDLSTLQRGDVGRQNDRSAVWPNGFEVEGPIVVLRVRDLSNGRVYLADPEALAEGRAELHHYLLAAEGVVTGKQRAVRLVREHVRARVREALVRAGGELAAKLPAVLAGKAPELVAGMLAALVRR